MSRATIDDVVLSLLRFEHRYVPYEGMRRDELFAAVMADLDHDVDARALLAQAYRRVVDMAADALAGEEEGADMPVAEVTIVAAACAAWAEGFAVGIFHARRLAEPQ